MYWHRIAPRFHSFGRVLLWASYKGRSGPVEPATGAKVMALFKMGADGSMGSAPGLSDGHSPGAISKAPTGIIRRQALSLSILLPHYHFHYHSQHTLHYHSLPLPSVGGLDLETHDIELLDAGVGVHQDPIAASAQMEKRTCVQKRQLICYSHVFAVLSSYVGLVGKTRRRTK